MTGIIDSLKPHLLGGCTRNHVAFQGLEGMERGLLLLLLLLQIGLASYDEV